LPRHTTRPLDQGEKRRSLIAFRARSRLVVSRSSTCERSDRQLHIAPNLLRTTRQPAPHLAHPSSNDSGKPPLLHRSRTRASSRSPQPRQRHRCEERELGTYRRGFDQVGKESRTKLIYSLRTTVYSLPADSFGSGSAGLGALRTVPCNPGRAHNGEPLDTQVLQRLTQEAARGRPAQRQHLLGFPKRVPNLRIPLRQPG